MSAYYNEIDPYAVQWLRNLVAAGHIAPGVVDERSIVDVRADDLRGYTQCHFFAGIGVWGHALRLAGWPDDRPVWTGSCPCQPFSAAGKQAGTSDERHLWPAWFNLVRQCNPPVVFGEQVEAAIRHGWLDLVQADMEGIGYAFAAAGIPAAGFGAPHIRQRLWFVADALFDGAESIPGNSCEQKGAVVGIDRSSPRTGAAARNSSTFGIVGRPGSEGLEGFGSGHQAEGRQRAGAVRPAASSSESGGVGDPYSERHAGQYALLRPENNGRIAAKGVSETTGSSEISRPGPTNGHWRNADWLHCRDGKWRPVEPGTFPLAHGAAARVGRLRAYGNAIVPQVAAEVISAYMECRP